MADKFVSVTIAPWHAKRLDAPTKVGLRAMLATHPDTEFYVHGFTTSGYTTLREAARLGVEELTVRSRDMVQIIGVIVPRLTDDPDRPVQVVVK